MCVGGAGAGVGRGEGYIINVLSLTCPASAADDQERSVWPQLDLPLLGDLSEQCQLVSGGGGV